MKQCQETLWFWKGRKWRKVSENKVTEGNTHAHRQKKVLIHAPCLRKSRGHIDLVQ